MPIILALIFVFAATTQVFAVEGAQPTGLGEVKGDVMYWEEGDLIVKEMSGEHQRLHVTAETKLVGVISTLKAGDKVTAQVDGNGNARSITLQIPGEGERMTRPGSR